MGGGHHGDARGGLLYGLAAYGLWGVMPLYFTAVKVVPPVELLAHRVLWSVVLLAALLTWLGRWGEVWACLREPRTRLLLLTTTVLIGVNWFVFIYGVSTGQVVQNSLGYFINPLLSVVLGVVFFRERLRPAQWLALALAAGGIVYLVAASGQLPGIALFLASSFALYGLLRKLAPADGLVGLSVETLLLAPVAGVFLAVWSAEGRGSLGRHGWGVDALLLASGAVTAVPLICFGEAARRLRLSTLGFLQYLAPTLQFLLAVTVLGEPFTPAQRVAFPCVWAALGLVTADSLVRARRPAAEKETILISPGD